jgi:hypothetical protein
LPPAMTAASMRSRRWPGSPLMSKTVSGIPLNCTTSRTPGLESSIRASEPALASNGRNSEPDFSGQTAQTGAVCGGIFLRGRGADWFELGLPISPNLNHSNLHARQVHQGCNPHAGPSTLLRVFNPLQCVEPAEERHFDESSRVDERFQVVPFSDAPRFPGLWCLNREKKAVSTADGLVQNQTTRKSQSPPRPDDRVAAPSQFPVKDEFRRHSIQFRPQPHWDSGRISRRGLMRADICSNGPKVFSRAVPAAPGLRA